MSHILGIFISLSFPFLVPLCPDPYGQRTTPSLPKLHYIIYEQPLSVEVFVRTLVSYLALQLYTLV